MPSEQDSGKQEEEVTQEVTIKHILDGCLILRCCERKRQMGYMRKKMYATNLFVSLLHLPWVKGEALPTHLVGARDDGSLRAERAILSLRTVQRATVPEQTCTNFFANSN